MKLRRCVHFLIFTFTNVMPLCRYAVRCMWALFLYTSTLFLVVSVFCCNFAAEFECVSAKRFRRSLPLWFRFLAEALPATAPCPSPLIDFILVSFLLLRGRLFLLLCFCLLCFMDTKVSGTSSSHCLLFNEKCHPMLAKGEGQIVTPLFV